MAVTIKDIAKILNISHTTVSRALNDSPLINEDTKVKIKALAKELNYVPNYNAKNLVLCKSHNIGLFFSTMNQETSHSFFFETVRGVNNSIGENYNLVVKSIDHYNDNFTTIDSQRFDGIILMSQSEQDNSFIYHVLSKKIPLVVLNRDINDSQLINILPADRKGAYDAVSYLIAKRHKRIAIIEGKSGFKAAEERKEGYMRALMDNHLPVEGDLMIKGSFTMESGYTAMQQLLQISNRPTAVFCCNDEMAVGAMKAIHEAGLHIPDDISIMGFDDSPFGSYITPSLSTVKRSICSVSEEGATRLLKIMHQPNYPGEKIFIGTEIMERASVGELD
ncbi:LacI family DNA-binding transcriptional regulator [Paenibacillus marinisediminis]